MIHIIRVTIFILVLRYLETYEIEINVLQTRIVLTKILSNLFITL